MSHLGARQATHRSERGRGSERAIAARGRDLAAQPLVDREA